MPRAPHILSTVPNIRRLRFVIQPGYFLGHDDLSSLVQPHGGRHRAGNLPISLQPLNVRRYSCSISYPFESSLGALEVMWWFLVTLQQKSQDTVGLRAVILDTEGQTGQSSVQADDLRMDRASERP